MGDIQREPKLIAVIDDDESVRSAIHGALSSFGFDARLFASAEEFLGSGLSDRIACLITDMQMPGMSGFELHAELGRSGVQIPVIMITAFGDSRTRAQALKAGITQFLDKPFDDNVLLEAVRVALRE